jgi:hypothetical protein
MMPVQSVGGCDYVTNRKPATGSQCQLPARHQTKKTNAFKGYHDAFPALDILTHIKRNCSHCLEPY